MRNDRKSFKFLLTSFGPVKEFSSQERSISPGEPENMKLNRFQCASLGQSALTWRTRRAWQTLKTLERDRKIWICELGYPLLGNILITLGPGEPIGPALPGSPLGPGGPGKPGGPTAEETLY